MGNQFRSISPNFSPLVCSRLEKDSVCRYLYIQGGKVGYHTYNNNFSCSSPSPATKPHTTLYKHVCQCRSLYPMGKEMDDLHGGLAAQVEPATDNLATMGAAGRREFVERTIKHVEHDNLRLLQKIKERFERVGMELPNLEVRYSNLKVEAACKVVHGKPIPTLWNSFKSFFLDFMNLYQLFSQETKITIIDDVSGVIKPGRMTLLLGHPGCGKTTFLKALSGNLSKSMQVTGKVTYNGYKLDEFIPQRTSVYISQNDLQIPELTVRETLDFSARCQGVGSRADILLEISRREEEAGIVPYPDIDTYMKDISANAKKSTLQTDYILKILGLDICADTLVGNAMIRGISGGQKKRLTTGEMIVGPTKAFFMDEISNGLDSSTAYQIITYLQQLAHVSDATVIVALLQPAPEIFDLFDDVVLMSEGKVVYHGPCSEVLEFFEDSGFRCPERKGVADFLQEVLSRKDQAQYWHRVDESYSYIAGDFFTRKFKDSVLGKRLQDELSDPFLKPNIQDRDFSFHKYSLSKWVLFRTCMAREFLLMRRNSFVYVFKGFQIFITASVTMTVFLRTEMEVDEIHANYYLSALFFGLMILFVDGMPELTMTVARLPIFYKQRDLYFYPAWAFSIPVTILKVPVSLLEALIWTSLTYYTIGYTPEVGRFFRQLILLFSVHLMATSMFHFLASIFRTMVASLIAGSFSILILLLFGGFIIPKTSMPIWLKWGTWISPLTYGELGLALNEFLSPRWQKALPSRSTIGLETLKSMGLQFDKNFFWISVGALLGLTIIFNIGFTLALTFLSPPGSSAVISSEKFSKLRGTGDISKDLHVRTKSRRTSPKISKEPNDGRMVLPFEPLTIAFEDVQYYVDTPPPMRERGFTEKQIQLLCNITGAFRPGVLTALMGVSGAGKTTLLDVLAGRKTSGTVEGEIRIGGYPKVQETFARISGYCEQTDVHSSQLTVEESILYSAWLRLDPTIDDKSKFEFAEEVMETIELGEIKDCLVGLPSISGLSTEQRKRLTIAVELVANPSIIFMDEPTTGLDARAAAIVMRAVKKVANTGRTIVCTIHQPSIDIFETFDELMLLKAGGHIIYFGPLGLHSSSVIKYFEDIEGVPKIKDNLNPATWMLEVTSTSAESELGVDLAQVYKKSVLCQNNQDLVMILRTPLPGSRELHFPSRFSQNGWGQFKCCIWKQYLSYWRSPTYNLKRVLFLLVASLILGIVFWDHGTKLKDQQSLFTIFGSMFSAAILTGLNNCAAVIPYVSTERSVLYRERFAGMYSSWAYALAQVTIEIPYVLTQAVGFVIITYPMIGFYWSFYKVTWYFYTMFCTLLYYTYIGMLLVSITPSFPIAATSQAAVYTTFNLFSGFFVPRLQIPKWWVWMYYVTPTSWTMNAMLTSQYGDIDAEIVVLGKRKTVAAFLQDYYGYHHDKLPFVALALFLYPILFASTFAYCIGKLNFQKR